MKKKELKLPHFRRNIETIYRGHSKQLILKISLNLPAHQKHKKEK